MDKIGLVAGNRKFPLIFAEAAKKKGCYVVAVGVKGDTSSALSKIVDKMHWLNLADFPKIPDIFKAEGISAAVMAGQISPRRLFSKEVLNNAELKEFLGQMQDRKPSTIFSDIINNFEISGLKILDSTTFLEDYLPKTGKLTKNEPSSQEWEDVCFGLELARQMANLDVGQTVAVRNKAIVAVEALEGTDNLIRRAGKLVRQGLVIVKVSRPRQDMRFDIPVVGLNTIKSLIKAGAKCLAIESGKTLFIDKEKSINLAERKGIAIVAVS